MGARRNIPLPCLRERVRKTLRRGKPHIPRSYVRRAAADLSAATFIDEYAFYGTAALTEVTLGEALASMGEGAFEETSLVRVHLGKAFSSAFESSLFPETLEEITVSAENPSYACVGNVVDRGMSEIVFIPYAVKGSVLFRL